MRWPGRRSHHRRAARGDAPPRVKWERKAWAQPDGPPTPQVDATALLGRVAALGLDDERRAHAEPETLWAAGWEPPALTAPEAVSQIAQGCADVMVLQPLDVLDAERILHRLWPLDTALRALVALRVTTYEERSADPVAYHGSDLADALGWAGELLDRANVARAPITSPEDAWGAATFASRWCGSLASRSFPQPDHGELLDTARTLTRVARDADFGPQLEVAPDAPAPSRAVSDLCVCVGATLLRAVAADLPATAALLAGARHADGLRLLPAPSVAMAALLEVTDDRIEIFWRVQSPDDFTWAVMELEAACDEVVRAWRENPALDPHGDFPPDAAFDASAMDRAEAALQRIAEGVETGLAAEPSVPLVGPLALTAAGLCRNLRAERGAYLWDETAFALEGLGHLTARLYCAAVVARRRL